MTYPPPPMLTLMAYGFGHISKAECVHMLELWYEKHPKEDDDEQTD